MHICCMTQAVASKSFGSVVLSALPSHAYLIPVWTLRNARSRLPNRTIARTQRVTHTLSLWDKNTKEMMLLFKASGHPVFRATSLSPRGPLKSKVDGTSSIHYSTEPTTSFNQLSFYGVIEDWCQELAQRAEAHSPQSTMTLEWAMKLHQKFHREMYEVLPKDLSGVLDPEGIWCGKAKRKSKIFQNVFN